MGTTTFPDELKRLVEQFHQQSDRIRTDAYNETQVRIDFIDPMMKALGWDMNNAQGFAEQYREVVHEDRVKVGGQTKAPDYLRHAPSVADPAAATALSFEPRLFRKLDLPELGGGLSGGCIR